MSRAEWRRTFFVVWTANLVTSIGMMSFLPFFPSLLREMGVADDASVRLWAGACFGAAPLSATLMSPVWGALGDRLGRKVMVCRAMLAISLFVGGMAFATSPVQLLLLRICQGLFSGFIPPSITLVSVSAPEDKQGRVAGWLTTSLAIGGMFGPLMGGWLAIATGSRQTVFLVVGGLALTSTLLVALFAKEDVSQRRVEASGDASRLRGALRSLKSDVGQVLANPVMRSAAGIVFAMQLALGAVNPILEEYVAELFGGAGLDVAAWGEWFLALPGLALADTADVTTFATSVSFGAMAVANLVSLPMWGRYGDRVGHKRALSACALGGVVALAVQACAPSYGLLLLGRLGMGVSFGGIAPLAFGLAAAETGAESRGGAMGTVFSARTLAVAIGGPLGGLLAGYLPLRALMAIGAAVVAAALVPYVRSSARTRRALSRS